MQRWMRGSDLPLVKMSGRTGLFCVLSLLAGCSVEFAVPAFQIDVELPTKVKQGLVSQNETVLVVVYYRGTEAAVFTPGAGVPIVGREEYELDPRRALTASVPAHALSVRRGNESKGILVNVITGRKSSDHNLLDCGIFEADSLTAVAGETIRLSCSALPQGLSAP